MNPSARIALVVAIAALAVAVDAGLFASFPALGYALLALPFATVVALSPWAGVAVLLFCLPLEELGGLSPGGSLTVMKLAGVSVFGGWLLRSLVTRRPIRLSPYTIPLALFVVWGASSALWSPYPDTVQHGIVTLAQLLSLYVLLANTLDEPAALSRALSAYALGGIALASLTFYLVATGVLQAGRAAVVIDQQMLVESNALAAGLLVPLAICLARVADPPRSLIDAAISWTGTAFCLVAIALTMSRGALVAVALMGLVVAALRRRTVAGVLVVGVMVPILLLAVPGLAERFIEGLTLSDRGAGRLDIWEVGWAVIRANPLLGVGLGAFPTVYYDYLSQASGIAWQHVASLQNLAYQRPPHNTFLGATAELGPIGLLLVVGAILVHARAAFETHRTLRAMRHPAARDLLGILLAIVGLTAISFVFDCTGKKYLWATLALGSVGRAAVRRVAARRRGNIAPARYDIVEGAPGYPDVRHA